MRNWIFHNILIRFAGSKDNRIKYIRKLLSLAALLGGPDVVIMGDSNAETLDKKEKALKFKGLGLVINIAIGGTTAGAWIILLNQHRDIYDSIKKAKIFMNIGGNHCWMEQTMIPARSELVVLRNLLPNSWNMTIPPIHSEIIEQLSNQPPGSINNNVLVINDYIREIWKLKAIDIHALFANWRGTGAYLFVLKDLVHFSDEADYKVRIPLIRGALKL